MAAHIVYTSSYPNAPGGKHMTTQETRSTEWEQESFEQTDRRRSRKELAVGSQKRHDLLHFNFEPASGQHVHAILGEKTRHTDSVHTHGAAVFLACAPGDAAGLRAKLEPHFKAKNLPVVMSHDTFAAGDELAGNLDNLKGR
jgi:hypothetical protein